jgi:SCY1-like protein 1
MLRQLDASLEKYPPGFLHHKILPEMLKSFEFGGASTKTFGIILSIAEKLGEEDFERDVQPVIIRMFGSQERGVRMVLLENLGKIVDRLPVKAVNDKIFPNLVSSPRHLFWRRADLGGWGIYGCCACCS